MEMRDSEDQILAEFSISTSKFGLGAEEGSYRTPLGWFQICEKYGDGCPLHTVFKGRVPTGEWSEEGDHQSDLVLTRILRLEGLEKENENTYSRYIYIHGTNQESQIGTPASMGCIRMNNKEIIDLYPEIELGTRVLIEES